MTESSGDQLTQAVYCNKSLIKNTRTWKEGTAGSTPGDLSLGQGAVMTDRLTRQGWFIYQRQEAPGLSQLCALAHPSPNQIPPPLNRPQTCVPLWMDNLKSRQAFPRQGAPGVDHGPQDHHSLAQELGEGQMQICFLQGKHGTLHPTGLIIVNYS